MIIRTTSGHSVERRSFALTDMLSYGYSGLRGSASLTGVKTIRGIPAINRAARIRSEAIAALNLKVWRGEDIEKEEVARTWQARLFRGPRANEQQTNFVFWDCIGESQAYRNNAFIWKNIDPMVGRVVEWYALHPDQVTPIGSDGWSVRVGEGYCDPVGRGDAVYEVGPETILHIRGHGDGGRRLAPTPVEVFREALQAPIERMRYENRVWQKGTGVKLGVEFPANVTADQADQWREMWKATYEGVDGDTTAVIGGGGTFKQIGMTLADASFVELAKLTVIDASRIMGVPANLLGAQLERTTPNLEQDLAMFLRFTLGPDLARIENALHADGYLFADGTDLYPMFESDEFVRGDLLTEANVMHMQIQDGLLLPDEGRKKLGWPPLPGGVGQIPQITPVGGAPNPDAIPAVPAVPATPQT